MKKRLSLSTLLVMVFISILSTFVGILTNLVSNQIPSQFIPYLRFAWPLLGVAIIAFIGLTVWYTTRQSLNDNGTSPPISGVYQQIIDKRNRQRMIKKVYSFWITGVLEKSLHGAVLDEVIQVARADCIDSINTYRKEHGLLPIVVCSRRTDYIAHTARLFLYNAVIIQALTPQQVDDFLSSAGEQLAAVRVALRSDQELQELVQTPLMLSVLALAYHGMTAEDLLTVGSIEARRQRTFKTYIRRMLERRIGFLRAHFAFTVVFLLGLSMCYWLAQL